MATLKKERDESSGDVEKTLQTCYELNGHVLVPHYREKGMYALPHGGEIPEYDLILRGARQTKRFLWKRPD